MSKNNKPVVQYRFSPHTYIRVGTGALVVPVDHPDTENVTNGLAAYTSEVVKYDEATGEFETKNTRYVPEKVEAAKEEKPVATAE